MATLIPALGSCTARMTGGERRLAERLEQKLDADYLLWYDVPIGPKQTHPDFVLLHPRRGLLILETKAWKLETILEASRDQWRIVADGGSKTVVNPLVQARHGAIQVKEALERDKQLIHPSGPHQGKLAFPWGYGVVLTHITRHQFEQAGLADAIAPDHVICADEMFADADAEKFQQRLWNMFPHSFGNVMSLPQLDRIRWIMFPEVRVPAQGALFDGDDEADLPDVMRVMDLQQEQLARSLGDGHRVVHGVAGSGKTMILGYRAEYLAKASGANAKPILVLCFNEPLAVKLDAQFVAKGLADRVHCRHFHRWCRQQLVAYGQTPPQGEGMFAQMVDDVIRAVDQAHIPSGQYQAILIDEGHDFEPHWLKLVTQMVDPSTNSLLVLYDDAQSINARAKSKQFSFKSVGIQAQGRTSILRINYRNTRQVLQVANMIAAEVLAPETTDDDGIPRVKPMSAGREGPPPLVIDLPTLDAEAAKLAELLQAAHAEGFAWSDMAILCSDWAAMDRCAGRLRRKRVPFELRKRAGEFRPDHDSIKVMTMKISKGLEFPVVALAGVGGMPRSREAALDEARLFYVAATRATSKLIVTVVGDGAFGQRLLGKSASIAATS